MNKKLQVFVSSTYADLFEERQAVVSAILDAGHIPAGMELFKAGKSMMKTIQKWIDDSDVYLLLLGGRYGSIEEESGLSYTELEYKYALSKGMPVFSIVLDDSFLCTKAASMGKNAVFEKDNPEKYDVFKAYVKSNIVRFAVNCEKIESIVHAQLNEIMNDTEYNLVGWIRSNSVFKDDKIGDYSVSEYKKIMESQIFQVYPNEPYSGPDEIVINAWELFKHKDFFNAVSGHCLSRDFLGSYVEEVFYDTVVDFYVKLGLLAETNRDGHLFADLSENGYKLFSKIQ